MKPTGSPTPTSPFCITLGPFIIEAVIPTIAASHFDTIHSSCRIYQASFVKNPASIPTPYIKSRRTANREQRKK
jgi:hypothetical protein